MVSFTLKNIPESLHRKLKKEAETNHRSLNSEILLRLSRTTDITPVNVKAVLETARALRRKVKGPFDQKLVDQWKNEGRP